MKKIKPILQKSPSYLKIPYLKNNMSVGQIWSDSVIRPFSCYYSIGYVTIPLLGYNKIGNYY